MPDALIVVLATFPALAVVAIVIAYLHSRSGDRRALVETNAMLSHLARKSVDAAVCGEYSQIDRIQSENELITTLKRKPKEQFNQIGEDLYSPPRMDDLDELRNERDTPTGSGV